MRNVFDRSDFLCSDIDIEICLSLHACAEENYKKVIIYSVCHLPVKQIYFEKKASLKTFYHYFSFPATKKIILIYTVSIRTLNARISALLHLSLQNHAIFLKHDWEAYCHNIIHTKISYVKKIHIAACPALRDVNVLSSPPGGRESDRVRPAR